MTQKQFLRSLSHKLRGVPAPEREEALRYYREYLQDAALEPKADVTPLVGTPGECARGILADNLIRQEQAAQQAAEPARSDGGRVVLGVLMLPVWLIASAARQRCLRRFSWSGSSGRRSWSRATGCC